MQTQKPNKANDLNWALGLYHSRILNSVELLRKKEIDEAMKIQKQTKLIFLGQKKKRKTFWNNKTMSKISI